MKTSPAKATRTTSPLQHRIGDAAKEVAVSGSRQQVGEWLPVIGHRVLGRSGVEALQLLPSSQADAARRLA
jgi:hypothetical protein